MKSLLRVCLFALLLPLARAMTIIYPVEAIDDLWTLPYDEFREKYAGINITGLGASDEGWYIRYRHENLQYLFGPLADRAGPLDTALNLPPEWGDLPADPGCPHRVPGLGRTRGLRYLMRLAIRPRIVARGAGCGVGARSHAPTVLPIPFGKAGEIMHIQKYDYDYSRRAFMEKRRPVFTGR